MTDNAESAFAEKKKDKRKRHANVLFYGAECKYPVIRDLVKEMEWTWVEEGSKHADNCHLYWIDVANIQERFAKVQRWQRVNHFPGMPHIARKTRMAQNLDKMRRAFPLEYNFYPRTWVLPSDFADFRAQFDANGRSKTVFIIKPDGGCQGRGIFLTQSLDDISITDNVVAQQYIMRPLLIDDFKFDLRIYVFVASCKPLRMYIFKDGLVRLCTEEYVAPTAENLGARCVHLTNYAVNKRNSNFEQNDDPTQEHASKRSVQWFLQWVDEKFGAGKSKTLWNRIKRICARTIIPILPLLAREYESTFKLADQQQPPYASVPHPPATAAEGTDGDSRTPPPDVKGSRCFEVLGFDIMVQANMQPRLIEVNHLPSFGTDSALDYDVKSRLLGAVLRSLPVAAHDPVTHQRRAKYLSEERLTRAQVQKLAAKPERDEQQLKARVREVFAKLYPNKADQVDAMLGKYQGKEEKFLAWLESKLRAKNDSDAKAKETRKTSGAEGDGEEANGDGAPGPASEAAVLFSEPVTAVEPAQDASAAEAAAAEAAAAAVVTDADQAATPRMEHSPRKSTENDGIEGLAAHQRLGASDSTPGRPPRSNKAKRRASDPKQEEEKLEALAAQQRRQAVLAAFCCSEDDPQFLEERNVLTEFDVLFPAPKRASPRDEENDELDENNPEAANSKSPRQKRKRASLEDLICHAFELDYKQMIRLRQPIHRRPSDPAAGRGIADLAKANGSLPARQSYQEMPEPEKKAVRVPDAAQIEAAERLMKGFSTIKSLSAPTSLTDPDMLVDVSPPGSAPHQGREQAPLAASELGNYIQLPPIERRRHHKVDPDNTISYALAQRISRMQQEGRQLRQKTQNRHNERKALCTAIVRQQVFSFAMQFPELQPAAQIGSDSKHFAANFKQAAFRPSHR